MYLDCVSSCSFIINSYHFSISARPSPPFTHIDVIPTSLRCHRGVVTKGGRINHCAASLLINAIIYFIGGEGVRKGLVGGVRKD